MYYSALVMHKPFNSIQFTLIQYSTIQYNTIQFNSIQFTLIQFEEFALIFLTIFLIFHCVGLKDKGTDILRMCQQSRAEQNTAEQSCENGPQQLSVCVVGVCVID